MKFMARFLMKKMIRNRREKMKRWNLWRKWILKSVLSKPRWPAGIGHNPGRMSLALPCLAEIFPSLPSGCVRSTLMPSPTRGPSTPPPSLPWWMSQPRGEHKAPGTMWGNYFTLSSFPAADVTLRMKNYHPLQFPSCWCDSSHEQLSPSPISQLQM